MGSFVKQVVAHHLLKKNPCKKYIVLVESYTLLGEIDVEWVKVMDGRQVRISWPRLVTDVLELKCRLGEIQQRKGEKVKLMMNELDKSYSPQMTVLYFS